MKKPDFQDKYRNIVPLPGNFMLTAIVGFLISVFYIYPNSKPWGFTFSLFFLIMIISSLLSTAHSPVEFPVKTPGKSKSRGKLSKLKKRSRKRK